MNKINLDILKSCVWDVTKWTLMFVGGIILTILWFALIISKFEPLPYGIFILIFPFVILGMCIAIHICYITKINEPEPDGEEGDSY